MIFKPSASVLLAALGLPLAACQPKAPPAQRPVVTLPVIASTDINTGKKLYQDECGKCHQIVEGHNSKGPQLDRIYGAKAAILADYQDRYSVALKQSGFVWDAITLDRYIANPDKTLPNSKMLYDGLPDANQRQAIVAYLSTLRRPDTQKNPSN